MAQQKRDPETGKFISRSAFYEKYPDGLTPEEYVLIRNRKKETETKEERIEQIVEAIKQDAAKDEELDIQYYNNDDTYISAYKQGCIAAIVIAMLVVLVAGVIILSL